MLSPERWARFDAALELAIARLEQVFQRSLLRTPAPPARALLARGEAA